MLLELLIEQLIIHCIFALLYFDGYMLTCIITRWKDHKNKK